jgi:L-threonylcarbamoyladenylate synthase
LKTMPPEKAAEALRSGEVALVPTETVVGLVAAESGLPRVREIKGRDADKPIALLCSSAEEAFALAANVPPLAVKLADLYWPGPLTLVLDLPSGETIGLRVPAGKAARKLIDAYGGPLYATSANLSGEPARAAPEEVDPHVLEAVDIIVRGEKGSGEASAVVDLSRGSMQLLRPDSELSTEKLSQLASE